MHYLYFYSSLLLSRLLIIVVHYFLIKLIGTSKRNDDKEINVLGKF